MPGHTPLLKPGAARVARQGKALNAHLSPNGQRAPHHWDDFKKGLSQAKTRPLKTRLLWHNICSTESPLTAMMETSTPFAAWLRSWDYQRPRKWCEPGQPHRPKILPEPQSEMCELAGAHSHRLRAPGLAPVTPPQESPSMGAACSTAAPDQVARRTVGNRVVPRESSRLSSLRGMKAVAF